MTIKILVLASNPQGTEQLRLNPEIREIEDALEQGQQSDSFDLRSRVAVRVADLQKSIQKSKARIVHFCGHGTGSQGLVLETDSGEQQLLDTKAIADLFALFKNQVECVVLNACYSEEQAQEIRQHINYVIGTQKAIRDDAALAFSKGFYEALGNGEIITRAFEFGQNRIQLEIYGESQNSRKLIPIFSSDENRWLELPEHEIVKLLIKDEPLNSIQQSDADFVLDRQAIAARPFIAKSPYMGLKRFNAQDKDLFFGRDRLIFKLIEAVNHSNLVLVLGASGSGKSSVVRAGVIPQLGNVSGISYQNCFFTPNRNPFVSLYRSLLDPNRDIFSESEVDFIKEGKKETIRQVVNLLKTQNSNWLIFIDQFEELFTICKDRKIRSNFIQGLINITQGNNSQIKLILAMRSDFLEELSAYPQFVKIFQKQIHLVTEMQPNELRQAIELPAAKHGIMFELGEPDLVTKIIQDVRGQAGSLPLLQYTLNLLWQNDDLSDRELNMVTYHQLGGVTGALQKHVNQIYYQLPQEQRQATKQILLKLVDVVNEDKSELLRTAVSKRANKSEFSPAQLETIKLLVKENLLISGDLDLAKEGQSTVEIAHEALLYSWKELKKWIKDARSTISLHNRLTEDAQHYLELKQQNPHQAQEELWSGSKLEKAIELKKEETFDLVLGGLSDDVEVFLADSIKQRDKEREEKIAAAEKLAKASRIAKEEAEKRVQEQKKFNKKLLLGTISTFSFGLTASILGVIFYIGGQKALLSERATNIRFKLSLSNEIEYLFESIQLLKDNLSFNKRQQWFRSPDELFSDVQSVLYQSIEETRERYVFEDHEDFVNSVAISGDGQYIVSGSRDGTIYLWLTKERRLISTIRENNSAINSVVISDDEKYIVSGSKDGKVRLWSLDKQQLKLTHTFEQDNSEIKFNEVHSVAISSDNKYIVSGSKDGKIRLWELNSQQLVRVFEQDNSEIKFNEVHSVAISSDRKYIVSGSKDGKIRLWELNSQQLVRVFEQDNSEIKFNEVHSVAISSDNKYIVSGIENGKIRIWNTKNESSPIHTFNAHKDRVISVAFSSDNKLIASGSWDSAIKLWNVKKNQLSVVHTFNGHRDRVHGIAFSPDGKQIVSGSRDNTLRLWDVEENKLLYEDTLQDSGGDAHAERVYPVIFSSDGQYIVSASMDKKIKLWNVRDKSLVDSFIDKNAFGNAHKDKIFSLALSSDNKYLASGSWDRTIKLWDFRKRTLIGSFEYDRTNDPGKAHGRWIYSVAFSPDDRYLASSSRDRTIKLWDVEKLLAGNNDALIDSFVDRKSNLDTAHEDRVSSLAFSPDGKHLVSGSWDNKFKLWDVKNRKLIKIFDINQGKKKSVTGRVNSVAFSSDGKYIASGSFNWKAQLWDKDNNRRPIHTFSGHRDRVYHVAFSPDDQYLATGSWDNTIKLWNLEDKSLVFTINGHNDGVYSLDFSPDRKYLVSGSWDNTIKLWSMKTEWRDWLKIGCERIRFHPYLASEEIDSVPKVTDTCSEYSE